MSPTSVIPQYDPLIVDGKPVGKLKASWLLFKETWRFLLADVELLLIPIITTILTIVLFGLLIAVTVLTGMWSGLGESEALSLREIGLLFLGYVVFAFTFALSQAAIIHTVVVRTNGGNASLSDSVSFAFSHWFSLFTWSLITSTVGVILDQISQRSQLLGKVVASLLGAGWAVLTYFVIPAMVVDGHSPFKSVKQSAVLFRQVWGETVVSNISLGLTFFVAHIVAILSAFGLVLVALALDSILLIVIIFTGYIIAFFALAIINSAMNGVLRALLYIYASSATLPSNFNPQLLEKVLLRQNRAPVAPIAQTNTV